MNEVGAAFIVDSMLGIGQNGGVGNGINLARANFADWQNRVRQLDSVGGVNWDYSPWTKTYCLGRSYVTTSTYSPDISDDVYWNEPCSNNAADSLPEIVFSFPGGKFEIGKQCGNVQNSHSPLPPVDHQPVGSVSVTCDPNTGYQNASVTFSDADGPTTATLSVNGWSSAVTSGSTTKLPLSNAPPYTQETVTLSVKDAPTMSSSQSFSTSTVVPCTTVSCSISGSTPSPLDPYAKFSVSVNASDSTGQTPPGAQVQLFITPPVGASFTYTSPVQALNGGPAVFSNIGPTQAAGLYSTRAVLSVPGLSDQTCTGTMPVVYLPYLNVYGGDVMTGAAPADGGTCSTNPAAGVYSWSQYGVAGYPGAGAEYAVQALAQIDEFGSAMNPSSSSPPIGLSFANSLIAASKVNPGQGLYGGYFGDSSGSWACGVDYTKGLTSKNGIDATTEINSIPPTPGNAQINDGQAPKIWATGDVYISRNIIYQPGAWPKVDQIPFFELVVTGGNIYIDSSVTQLDGIYIAEPSGGVGGHIIDCATNAGGIAKQVDPTVSGFYLTCNKQLVINGAFVAKQVLFGRTYGSLGQAAAGDSLSTNHDAEVFNYTPEIWLPRNAAAPSDTYDAITALPPVL